MALGFGAAGANVVLDAFNAAFPWVKLHTGDPGAAGTANAAANATRKQADDAPASGGASTTEAALSWTAGEVTTTETYTHYTRWSASSAGNFGASGLVSSGAVTAGTAFSLPIGDLDQSIPLAS